MRLVEENKTLAMERSHLSDLMSNVQRMHNDLERSGENDRRRLENQLQMLESQTYVGHCYFESLLPIHLYRQDLRTQLSQERDTVRHMSLQKDIQLKELQNRLDRAVCSTPHGFIGSNTQSSTIDSRPLENPRIPCWCRYEQEAS